MNGGHIFQSSLVQQLINTGNPNWWRSMRPPPPSSSCFFPPPNYAHDQSNELSWSQLLMGGLVNGEEEKQLDSYPNASLLMMGDVKQENSATMQQQYIHNYSNEDHHFHQASSPKSCVTTNNNNNMVDFSSKKSKGGHPPPDRSSSDQGNSPAKKPRVQSSSGQSTIKVRKEKLGDRVTALHQIVSPFGKTDTASVLLETIGYIRFLQSQIEALSLPYLGHNSANNSSPQQYDSQEEPKDLRSGGLCLVPISCTLQVGSDNGADFWAPSLGGGF